MGYNIISITKVGLVKLSVNVRSRGVIYNCKLRYYYHPPCNHHRLGLHRTEMLSVVEEDRQRSRLEVCLWNEGQRFITELLRLQFWRQHVSIHSHRWWGNRLRVFVADWRLVHSTWTELNYSDLNKSTQLLRAHNPAQSRRIDLLRTDWLQPLRTRSRSSRTPARAMRTRLESTRQKTAGTRASVGVRWEWADDYPSCRAVRSLFSPANLSASGVTKGEQGGSYSRVKHARGHKTSSTITCYD